jgi:2-oxoisovalerate dehydrogenase E1 component alpha subunit
MEAEKKVASGEDSYGNESEQASSTEFLDFPGGKVSYTNELQFLSGSSPVRVPCFQLLDEYGQVVEHACLPEVDKLLAVKMYRNMVLLQTMDTLFYEAQRQGQFTFYVTTIGEEAINIASAAALSNDDIVYAQYREPGVLLWRGFSLNEFANQCFTNNLDYGKGRQMPVHYGSSKLNYPTVSSPIATQLLHAVGAAYALKMENNPACTVTFFGDGASSEGDFHAAMNFAAVLEVPVLFICRNNGFAISTPTAEQFKSDGVVAKGQAYGMRSIRVDGNDTLAMYATIKAARVMAISESRPILIEALTYRVGHHSTSDDSAKYRKQDEMQHWKMIRDPVLRFRRWLEGQRWWDLEADKQLRSESRKEVLAAIRSAGPLKKPSLSSLFTDVYDSVPSNLKHQEEEVRATVSRHWSDYPPDVPL